MSVSSSFSPNYPADIGDMIAKFSRENANLTCLTANQFENSQKDIEQKVNTLGRLNIKSEQLDQIRQLLTDRLCALVIDRDKLGFLAELNEDVANQFIEQQVKRLADLTEKVVKLNTPLSTNTPQSNGAGFASLDEEESRSIDKPRREIQLSSWDPEKQVHIPVKLSITEKQEEKLKESSPFFNAMWTDFLEKTGDTIIKVDKEVFVTLLNLLERPAGIQNQPHILENEEQVKIYQETAKFLGLEAVTTVLISKEELDRRYNQYVFGPKKWAAHGVNIMDKNIPPFPIEELLKMDQPSPIFPGKKIYETGIFFLQPSRVSYGDPREIKAYSFNVSSDICNKVFKDGEHPMKYQYVSNGITQDLKSAIVDQPRWCFLTYILPESRSKTVAQQQEILQNQGFTEFPDLLSATTGMVLEYIEKGTTGFGCSTPEDPSLWTFTRCQEGGRDDIGEWKACVGALAAPGLEVSRNLCDHRTVGVAGLRKF